MENCVLFIENATVNGDFGVGVNSTLTLEADGGTVQVTGNIDLHGSSLAGLEAATVTGNVNLYDGSRLAAQDATINGGVQAYSSSGINLFHNATVTGSVLVSSLSILSLDSSSAVTVNVDCELSTYAFTSQGTVGGTLLINGFPPGDPNIAGIEGTAFDCHC